MYFRCPYLPAAVVALLIGVFCLVVQLQRRMAVSQSHVRIPTPILVNTESAVRQTFSRGEEEINRLRDELARLREELQIPADPQSDYALGLRPLAAFTNLGRGTPSAAFSTAIWAVLNGNDEVLSDCFAMTPETRESARQLMDGLPSADRAMFRSPEDLVALAFAHEMLSKIETLKITDGFRPPGENTKVLAQWRAPNGRVRKAAFPMEPTAGGWRIVISAAVVESLPDYFDRIPPERNE